MNFDQLKNKLDYHYKAFDTTQISPDPLQFLHLYKEEKDIELIGFLSSIFAYGNVMQIIKTVDKLNHQMNARPYDFILNFSRSDEKLLAEVKHRFYTSEDIIALLYVLKKLLKKHSSLKNIFYQFFNAEDENLKMPINNFAEYFLNTFPFVTPGIRFMFPLPELGSACKRMNLFLRWMVRKDELDFGFWDKIPPSKLIIPVDTHIAKICKELGLTDMKNVSWKMAEQITKNLAKFDPYDPVKYDFAICHIGMRKLSF